MLLMSHHDQVHKLINNVFDILSCTASPRNPLYIAASLLQIKSYAEASAMHDFRTSTSKLIIANLEMSRMQKMFFCRVNSSMSLFEGNFEKAIAFLTDLQKELARQYHWLNQDRCICIDALDFFFHPKFALLAMNFAMVYYYIESFQKSCEYVSTATTIHRMFAPQHYDISGMLRIFLLSHSSLQLKVEKTPSVQLISNFYKSVGGKIMPYTLVDNNIIIQTYLKKIAIDCHKLVENTFGVKHVQ
jgi:hypothetical protein